MMTFLYVLLALFVFGIMVMLHELGHFLVARAFGIGVHEFSIGMGPKLLSRRGKDDIEYSLRALPIGGFVSMVGEDEESDRPDAFGNKNVWQRIAVVLAGPVMNLILGFILIAVMVLGADKLASTTVGVFNEGAVSSSYGLAVGDKVVRVNGVRVHTGNELVYEIMNQGFEPLDLTVERDGQELVLTDVMFPGMQEKGVSFGTPDFRVFAEQKSFGNVMKHTYFRSVSTVKMIFDQLGGLLTGRFGMNAVSGPVGITEEMGNAAKSGADTFIYLVAILTVNLGVFNLLPIPALDGGRLLFMLVEAVTGRPVDKNVEGYIHFVGLMILFAIMIMVTCKDIAGLFTK